MKRFFSIIFTLGASLALIAGEGWQTDYEKAMAQAKSEGKKVLLNFSGSDWCGWCKKLDREVFNKDEFKQWAKDNVVLVNLDFPRNKKQDAKVVSQNNKLQRKFFVNGFPTVFLLDAEGEVLLRTGYMPGGPSNYINELKANM